MGGAAGDIENMGSTVSGAVLARPLPSQSVDRALARFSGEYEALGTVCTRAGGKDRVVEIELGFDGGRPLREILAVGEEMRQALAAELPDLRFRVVPTLV